MSAARLKALLNAGGASAREQPMSITAKPQQPKVSLFYDPKVRSITYQVGLCLIIAYLGYSAVTNAIENLQRAHIASGFGFWDHTAGFDISQTPIPYTQTSTYGRAFWVGLVNTLIVAGIGIVLATILGFLIGIARLSKNWLVSRAASGYVELIRNLPLL
ncbi:MAG TPA: ABC transporter permease subunit, partial [Xanthobacteraceae bacterium]|nr:ABC transporter permease subunit [Xanthobacteraceae bacterium]